MSNSELSQELYFAELQSAAAKVLALTNMIETLTLRASALESHYNNNTVWLKTTTPTNIKGGQTLEGNYYFGDESPVTPGQVLRGANVIFGPASSLEIRSLPRFAADAVNKGYVDNIISPLYTQLSQALTGKVISFITLKKSSGSNISLVAPDNVLSSSDNYASTFASFDSSIKCKSGGLYLIIFRLALTTTNPSLRVSMKVESSEIDNMVFSGSGSDTITMCVKISAGSVLSWETPVGSSYTVVNETLSLIKLGE